MLSFDELKEIASYLNNGGNLKKEEKQKLADYLKKMCEGQEEQSLEEAVDAFREKLKTEAKNELKADQALNDEVKAELSSEIQEKANKLEQIEKEKADLQTKFDAAEKEKTELQQQLDNLTKDATAIEDLFADGSIKTEIEGLIGSTGQELEGKIKDLYDGKLRSELKGILYEEFQEGIIRFIKDGKSAGEIEECIKEMLKHFNNESKIADLQQQLEAKDEEITALKAQVQQLQAAPNDTAAQLQTQDGQICGLLDKVTDLQEKNKELEAKLKAAEQKTNKLEGEVKTLTKEKEEFKTNNPDLVNLQKQLQAKGQEITQLKQHQSNVEQLNKDLTAKQQEVQQLQKKNKELEAAAQGAKNKTTEQPKQSNGAKYTATVGMGLAAGLIAFTALERTVRLEMLVMIGIAVTSALVVGGITYAVLPGTQVDEAKAQEVNENGKGK